MIFFVLSGFLIYLSIANNIKNSPSQRFDMKRYAISRLSRLYPPLLVSLIICAVIYFLLDYLNLNDAAEFSTGKEVYLARNQLTANFADMMGSLFFVNTIFDSVKTPSINGPLWSLAHEFWYYVVAALVVASYRTKKYVILLIAVGFFLYKNQFWLYGLAVWTGGAYSAWSYYNRRLLIVRRLNTVLAVIAGSTWAYMLAYASDDYFFNNRQKFMFGIFLATLLPIFLNSKNMLQRFSLNKLYRIVCSVSSYSYTLYLIHFPILLLIFVVLNKSINGNLAVLFIVTLLSACLIVLLSALIGVKVEDKNLIKNSIDFFKEKRKVAV